MIQPKVTGQAKNSLRAKVVDRVLRATFRPLMHPKVPVALQRALANSMQYGPKPGGVKVKPWSLGRPGSEVHIPNVLRSDEKVILYFHGGGFTIGSPAGHRALVARVAYESGLKTFAASYRLSPEAMFPAPQEDGLAAFNALLQEGYKAQNIIIAGDSAGGNLSIGVTKQILEQGGRAPAALVLISPVVDFTFSKTPYPVDDTLLPELWARENRWLYLTEAQTRNPLASPIFGDFEGFPPVFIQSSSVEFLANDSKRLAHALDKDGVNVTWEEEQGLWHDFQLQAGVVPESTAAVQRMGQFIQSLT